MREVKLSKDSAPVKVDKIETIGSIEQLNQLISEGKLKITVIQSGSESVKVSQPAGQVWKVEGQNQGVLKSNSFFQETGDGSPIIKTFNQIQNALYLKNKSDSLTLDFSVNGESFTLDPLEFFDDGLDPFTELTIVSGGEFKGYVKRLSEKAAETSQFFNSEFFDTQYFA